MKLYVSSTLLRTETKKVNYSHSLNSICLLTLPISSLFPLSLSLSYLLNLSHSKSYLLKTLFMQRISSLTYQFLPAKAVCLLIKKCSLKSWTSLRNCQISPRKMSVSMVAYFSWLVISCCSWTLRSPLTFPPTQLCN